MSFAARLLRLTDSKAYCRYAIRPVFGRTTHSLTRRNINDINCSSFIRHLRAQVSRSKQTPDKHEFQAETRSLYSENDVFIRELISNASDALEKFRFTCHKTGDDDKTYEAIDRPLEIRIATDKQNMQFTIQDTGIGMTRVELVNNLGTIARSGSKKILEKIRQEGTAQEKSSNSIRQFGVGFCSALMVAVKVEVFTRSSEAKSPGLCWSTDGSGSYEIQEADGVEYGTKIVIKLKPECREYADEDRIKSVIKKYSNFIGSLIYLNGKKANDIQPVWLMEPKDITDEQHKEFFRFIAHTFDAPRFVLHYKTDVPLSIRALLYFPEGKPGLFDLTRHDEVGLALYNRKLLIQSKTTKTANILPKWLRFVKGVVDYEDIPLNLSSVLIKKLGSVLTSRVLKFLQERANKQPSEFEAFYKDYGLFLKEGIVTSNDQTQKEDIAKLLRFESSKKPEGQRISLEEYIKNVGEQKDVYYLAADNRVLAESSPYYNNLKKRDIEVLFCYEPYDEFVLTQLGIFKNKNMVSVDPRDSRSVKTNMKSFLSGPFYMKKKTRSLLTTINSLLLRPFAGFDYKFSMKIKISKKIND